MPRAPPAWSARPASHGRGAESPRPSCTTPPISRTAGRTSIRRCCWRPARNIRTALCGPSPTALPTAGGAISFGRPKGPAPVRRVESPVGWTTSTSSWAPAMTPVRARCASGSSATTNSWANPRASPGSSHCRSSCAPATSWPPTTTPRTLSSGFWTRGRPDWAAPGPRPRCGSTTAASRSPSSRTPETRGT